MMVPPSQIETAMSLENDESTLSRTMRLRLEAEAEHMALDADLARTDLETKVETITPERAAAWVLRNVQNRGLSPTLVNCYARDMRDGRWQVNGESICFDQEGNLLNGQHRLWACIEAGVPFMTVVTRGLPSVARDSMDQGRSRKAADILKMHGYNNVSKLSGAARFLLVVKTGMLNSTARHMHTGRMSNAEITGLVERHPALVDSVMLTAQARGISQSQLSGIHFVGKHLLGEPDKADAFVNVFVTGVPSYPNDPAHRFRERNLTVRSRMVRAPVETIAFFSGMRAWNAFRKGEELLKFQVPRGPVYFDDLDPALI